jgi:hypothetical protein
MRFKDLREVILENEIQQDLEILSELTVSPHYQQKGVYNPYYTFKVDVDKDVLAKFPEAKSIKYKCVVTPRGELLKELGKGKFAFQVEVDNVETEYYVVSTIKNVAGHLGMKSRKDSTASSNVNEFLSLYFLLNDNMPADGAEAWMKMVGGMEGDTGVLNGEGAAVTYSDLKVLLDKDETAIRDINIGYENSIAVRNDLPQGQHPMKCFWVPRGKPDGIGGKNPSDIIIKLSDGSYIGYSNKISAGKDETPKFNTNITAFYGKLDDSRQVASIKHLIDSAWMEAESRIKGENALKALEKFDIKREKFSESSSKAKFAKLAKAFDADGLKFFEGDFYYPFRNTLIQSLCDYLTNTQNLVYLLNTVGYYTFDDPDATPCPYKLLVGSENGSKIKEVSSNDGYRDMLFNKNPAELKNVKYEYDGTKQSFKIQFTYQKLGMRVTVPITVRTRASGGWSGKSLYITSSGFIIK